jgi:hypothetical protein
LIKAHHHWHWVTEDGHLSLEPLRQTLRRHTHLSYMSQRDGFRAKRGAPPKWQGAHMGMIEHVWHPNKLSLSMRASTHRIVYDKGWHGGNRAKSPSPDGDDGTWGACGLCGEPDSQAHWIRSCQFEEVRSIRRDARISAWELVDNITSTKGNHQNRRDCFNVCSEVLTWAVEEDGGEQLWVGILPKPVVDELTLRVSRTPLDSPSRITASNLWTRSLKAILTILAKAAKAMWSVKEAHRRADTTGQPIPLPLTNHRKRSYQADIRRYCKRQKTKTGSLLLSDISLDDTPTATLLEEPTTLPPRGTRLRRTGSLHRTRLQSQVRTANHHSYFQSHRRRQDQLGQKRLRTPISALWDKVAGLEWLQDKDLGVGTIAAQQQADGAPEDGSSHTPTNHDCTNSSVDNTQLNANNNDNNLNLIEHNHNTDNLNNNDCSGRGSLGAPEGVD